MGSFKCKRPYINERLFKSEFVEDELQRISSGIQDKELAWIFENCFPNTLDTTVFYEEVNGVPDTYIITGDINAMWLRDSVAQIWPYRRYINIDERIDKLYQGLINRHLKCILLDPYANAVYKNFSETGPHISDKTEMKPGVHERKWEIDSLCYFIRLCYYYWKISSKYEVFNNEWLETVKLIISTFVNQQNYGEGNQYTFIRYENLNIFGKGMPTKKCGLIRSGFRPSDDPCMLHFLIPSNCFAVISLVQLSEMLTEMYPESELVAVCKKLADEIDVSIKQFGVNKHISGNEIFAYEVDGFGGRVFMDDANIPSLLSLPYLGYCSEELNIPYFES